MPFLPLPQPLENLLGAFHEVPVSARRITGVESAHGPQTFRIQTASGRVFKGRCVDWPMDATCHIKLRRISRGLPFNRLVAIDDRWTLESWVDGGSTARRDLRLSNLYQLGGMLRTLHESPIPAGVSISMRSIALRIEQAELELGRLCERHQLAIAQCRSIVDLLERVAPCPTTLRPAVIHRDFCLDNVVQALDGRLCLIDNTTLTIGVAEEDLARACYRSNLSHREETRFLAGYGDADSRTRFLKHHAFWMSLILIRSAYYRMTLESPLIRIPLAALNRTLNASSFR